MATLQITQATDSAIWNCLLQPGSKLLSLAAARSLLRLDFTPEDKARMHELAAKALAAVSALPRLRRQQFRR